MTLLDSYKDFVTLDKVLERLPREVVQKLPIVEWGGIKYVDNKVVESAAEQLNS